MATSELPGRPRAAGKPGPVRLVGTPSSEGVARGRVMRIERLEVRTLGHRTLEATAEVDRLRDAASATARASVALAERVRRGGHRAEAEIFAAHAAIADDPELLDAAAERIRGGGATAADAIVAAASDIADALSRLGDELLSGRAEDVRDVGENIARRLSGAAEATLDAPAIVVARDLPPSLTATLPRDKLLGIALESSSPTAHAAILARAYGIPAVVGVRGLLAALAAAGPHVEIAIDGSSGHVVIAPDASDVAAFAVRDAAMRRERERDAADAASPAVTRDGTAVTLLANIGGPSEAEAAIAAGAQGVGLFRTEFLFLERATPPSEDQQLAAYTAVVKAFAPRGVTIRLLDVGGDKPIPYLPIAGEANPFLGVRALRLAEDRPEIFITQLRACYRAAAAGDLKVMAPMVADARDVATLLDLAARARGELVAEGLPFAEIALGVMLEIPSAVLVAETYLGELSFASLGTNDLLQYTLAADRGNAKLERYRDPLHPAHLRLIKIAVEAAARGGVSLSVCGEMAADRLAALALVGLGVRSLSMVATSIAAVRRAIRNADADALTTAAAAALADPTADDVRARFAALTDTSPA
jgi:phosphoenolpyruvate-protein phosphotransferase